MVYSLASVTCVINNDTYGNIEFGGGNQTIGDIGYSFKEDSFSMKLYSDGGATVSYNASKGGTITVKMAQTSTKYKEIVSFIKWCRANPQLAESTMTVLDNGIGVMQFSAKGVFPQKEPDNSVSDDISDNQLDFLAAEIITENY